MACLSRGIQRVAPNWIWVYQFYSGHSLFFLLNLKQSPMFVATKISSGDLAGPGFGDTNLKNLATVWDTFCLTEGRWRKSPQNDHRLSETLNDGKVLWNYSNCQPEKADWRSKSFRSARNYAAKKSGYGTEFSVSMLSIRHWLQQINMFAVQSFSYA